MMSGNLLHVLQGAKSSGLYRKMSMFIKPISTDGLLIMAKNLI